MPNFIKIGDSEFVSVTRHVHGDAVFFILLHRVAAEIILCSICTNNTKINKFFGILFCTIIICTISGISLWS